MFPRKAAPVRTLHQATCRNHLPSKIEYKWVLNKQSKFEAGQRRYHANDTAIWFLSTLHTILQLGVGTRQDDGAHIILTLYGPKKLSRSSSSNLMNILPFCLKAALAVFEKTGRDSKTQCKSLEQCVYMSSRKVEETGCSIEEFRIVHSPTCTMLFQKQWFD